MKVLLFKDVSGIGRAQEIHDVSPGYVRNFLLPKKLATLVTPAVLAQYEQRREVEKAQQASSREEQEKAAARLPTVRPKISARANDKGQLYGRITSDDIVTALKAIGIIVASNAVHIDEPLTHIGEHTVTIHFRPDLRVPLILSIQPA